MTDKTDALLQERGKRYGDFADHARISRKIKKAIYSEWVGMPPTSSQAEALDMIAHKIARIVNGDADYADSWADIAGYARLVEKELQDD